MNTTELELMQAAVQFVENDIAIKPACELIGLSYQKQQKAIKEDEILGQLYTLRYAVGADFKQREMLCVPKHAFLMWIYQIEINRVRDAEAKRKLILMKKLVHNYIFQGEQKALTYETYIANLTNIIERKKACRDGIAAFNRELNHLNKEERELLAADPRQLAIPFETKQITN